MPTRLRVGLFRCGSLCPTGIFTFGRHGNGAPVCTFCMQFSPEPSAYGENITGSRAERRFRAWSYALVCVVCICLKREMPKIRPTPKTTAYTAYKRFKCPLMPTLYWHSAIWGGNAYKVHTSAYEMHTTPFFMVNCEGNVNDGASLPVLALTSPDCRFSEEPHVSP